MPPPLESWFSQFLDQLQEEPSQQGFHQSSYPQPSCSTQNQYVYQQDPPQDPSWDSQPSWPTQNQYLDQEQDPLQIQSWYPQPLCSTLNQCSYQQQDPPQQSSVFENMVVEPPAQRPVLEILIQPESEKRIRYATEGNNSPIKGSNSNQRKQTFPKVKLNWASCSPDSNMSIVVRCNLYTAAEEPRLHVHKLKEEINEEELARDYTAEFKNLVVVRKKKWEESLPKNENESEIKQHIVESGLLKMKLGFQAFVRGSDGNFKPFTDKIYSNIISQPFPIIKKKTINSGCWEGGYEMWLIVDNINPKQIAVHFFKGSELIACVTKNDFEICKSVIILNTPRYREITQPVEVNIELALEDECTFQRGDTNLRSCESFLYMPAKQYDVVQDHAEPICLPEKDLPNIDNDEIYKKLLAMWESKKPNRLQDIKVIIRGEGQKMGPLQAAAYHGQTESLQNLVSFIVQKLRLKWLISMRDTSGLTPLDIAIKHGKRDCENLLREAGAKQSIEDHQKQKCNNETEADSKLLSKTEKESENICETDEESEDTTDESYTSGEEEFSVVVDGYSSLQKKGSVKRGYKEQVDRHVKCLEESLGKVKI